jgi:hypothetical protein
MEYLKRAFRKCRDEDEQAEKEDFEAYIQDKVLVKLNEFTAYIRESGQFNEEINFTDMALGDLNDQLNQIHDAIDEGGVNEKNSAL